MLTTQKVDLIFKAGADFVATAEPSKFSCIGSRKWEVGDILWAKMDPAVGVWLLDRYLADLMNSKQNEYTKNFIIFWESKAHSKFCEYNYACSLISQ